VKSIRRIGLLVPPLLKPAGEKLIIVSGFLRLKACRQLGLHTVGARLVPEAFDAAACAHCAVAENGLQRQLNPLEAARGMAMLAAVIEDDQALSAEAAAAGLPGNFDMIAKLLQVSRLPAAVQGHLADGSIGVAMALELGRQPKEFSTACAEIFSELRVGLNRQRELLGLIVEISARDDLPPLDLVRMDVLQNIIGNADLERPQKINRIRDWLYHRRYPRLALAEDAFEEKRKRLKLGNNIQLKPPRFFESDRYTFSLQFSGIEELQEQLKRIESATGDAHLKDILSRSGKTSEPDA
jgi:ParB family chromosome partitioning protein